MEVLTNKQYKLQVRLSRYQSYPIYYNTLDNKWIRVHDNWLKDDTVYSLHKVVEGETLDSLALKYFNNPTYYGVIASFNGIYDPFRTLVTGDTLKIPVISFLEFKE